MAWGSQKGTLAVGLPTGKVVLTNFTENNSTHISKEFAPKHQR